MIYKYVCIYFNLKECKVAFSWSLYSLSQRAQVGDEKPLRDDDRASLAVRPRISLSA